MKGIAWTTAIAGAALVIAVAAARRSGAVPERASRSSSRPVEDAPIARDEPPQVPRSIPADVPPSVEREASDFWSEVGILMEAKTGPGGAGHRGAVLERTLRYLGWTDARRVAFASVSEAAAQEVEAAWSVREAQISAGDEAVQARYEERKRIALAPIEALLEPTLEREGRLRERLEEWIDAIR